MLHQPVELAGLIGTWHCGYCSAGCQASSQECLQPVPIEVNVCHQAEKACISAQLTLFFANSWIGEQIASLEEKCRTAKPPDGEMRKRIIPESWVRWWLYGSTRRTVAHSATRPSVSEEQSQKAPTRISGIPQALHCKKRATWRFPPRKPAERLSSYYGLDCEYGTSLMTCWQGGGTGPLYVCDDHAKNLELERDLRRFGSSNK